MASLATRGVSLVQSTTAAVAADGSEQVKSQGQASASRNARQSSQIGKGSGSLLPLGRGLRVRVARLLTQEVHPPRIASQGCVHRLDPLSWKSFTGGLE